jgi:hypothetical protein
MRTPRVGVDPGHGAAGCGGSCQQVEDATRAAAQVDGSLAGRQRDFPEQRDAFRTQLSGLPLEAGALFRVDAEGVRRAGIRARSSCHARIVTGPVSGAATAGLPWTYQALGREDHGWSSAFSAR